MVSHNPTAALCPVSGVIPLSRTAVTRTLGRIGPAPVDVRGRSPINAFVQVREKGSLCSRHLTSSLQKNTVMTILFFWPRCVPRRILARDRPCAPTLGVQRLNHQTARDISATTVLLEHPLGSAVKTLPLTCESVLSSMCEAHPE